jgi:hypothetical protein
MKLTNDAKPSPEGQRQLDALRRAVRRTLERKRQLGQYAIVWMDGKPVRVGMEAPNRPAR